MLEYDVKRKVRKTKVMILINIMLVIFTSNVYINIMLAKFY